MQPLTEDCGLIEWVPDTGGIRHVLQALYAGAGLFDRSSNNAVKKIYEAKTGTAVEKLRAALELFPPIFHRWFTAAFPEPAAWFRARMTFAHSVAVWSMVSGWWGQRGLCCMWG